jgi:hypothetical protein
VHAFEPFERGRCAGRGGGMSCAMARGYSEARRNYLKRGISA